MRTKSGIVAATVALALCCGYIAQGQNAEKKSDTPKKGTKTTAPPAKGADPGKKTAPEVKPAGTPPAEAAAEDPEAKAVRAGAAAFAKLYNAHDSKGLAGLFALKAEVIDEDGQVTKGRDAIEKAFAEVFKKTPKVSMTVDVDSVRVLSPLLAIEEGVVRSKADPDAAEDVSTYVAIHAKVDGKWLLGCVRDWGSTSGELTPHGHLQELSWLVGEWIDESPTSVVRTTCKWHDNGNFLMQEFSVNIEGRVAMSGTVRIGWDAVEKRFKSWMFDSLGGHAQGTWLQNGDEWYITSSGATAAGEAGSSVNVYRRIDDDTLGWRSINRVVDGERVDDIDEFIIKRRPPLPGE